MLYFLAALLAANQAALIGLLFLAKKWQKDEVYRTLMFANEAMDRIQAKSLDEKVAVENIRRTYDSQLEYYRDTMAKAYDPPPDAKAKEPRRLVVEDDLGQRHEFSENDLEVFD